MGTITSGSTDIGLALIIQGLAIPQPQYLGSDPERARIYQQAYADARRSKAGAHAGTFIEPSRWRSGARLTCEARR